METSAHHGELNGRVVALPETRQLDTLAGLLERRGATVWRCPMVAIHDTPDAGPVQRWLEAFVDDPPDDLILLTGEGLRRLFGFAERAGLDERFADALSRVRTITRGPKPARALREHGLTADLPASEPTSAGIRATLADERLAGRRVAVQLYGQEPNRPLIDFLEQAGAEVSTVAPYVYASAAEDERVTDLIRALAAGRIDALALTSSPQYQRLTAVARRTGLGDELHEGLDRVLVAAVGPIVAQALREDGVRVDVVPPSTYAMKPLVSALAGALTSAER